MTDSTVRTRTAAPRARLVHRRRPEQAPRAWDESTKRVFATTTPGVGWNPWQVLGGPGTGKTSLLVDVAVDRITGGEDPEHVLVLTQSRRAAGRLREEITAALLGQGEQHGARATREPLVRTVHSYAFAVLRLQAAAHGNPPPRLITGAEHDAVLREMLHGDIADGAHLWPERLRPALGLGGFAVEVRDLMLRASERGLGPEDLVALGRRHSRPEWVAAGKFAARYEHGMLLRGAVGVEAPEATAPALDAAELIGAALTAFATDPDLLRTERARVRHLLVDDAQHLDPQAAELVRLVGTGTRTTVVAGDPDQSIYGFRGADPAFLIGLADKGDERQIVLPLNFRSASTVAATSARITSRLPGRLPHRTWVPSNDGGRTSVHVLSTPAKEAAVIADTLRRAHLLDGVPWSDMAVIVRSVPRALAPLRRALLGAGVPVTTPASELPLARRHGVSGLMLVLRALSGEEFTGEDALALLAGPIGGAEPVALRRLRRGLRRAELASGGDRDSAELLRLILTGETGSTRKVVAKLTDVEAASLNRVLSVLRKARAQLDRGRGVEEVLWAAWQATGLERRWASASARGGPIGAQADRDLDAVVALFDAAAGYVDRLPRAQLAGFVDYLTGQAIPSSSRTASVVPSDAVTVLSAHSAAGREWDVVAVAGVQEGLWPSLRTRGSLLGTEALIDLVSGVSDGTAEAADRLSRTAPLLAEERRLFLVACSRARRSLLVTAVDSAGSDTDLVHSRFVDELLVGADGADVVDAVVPVMDPSTRVLALPALVAELRGVVCDPRVARDDPDRQRRAARQLARLARAGVRGAHPDQWYGTAEPSTAVALWTEEDGPVSLSPSTVDLLNTCPLRWLLERHGGSDGDNTHAIAGTLVHTLVQALAGRIPADQVERALEDAWDSIDLGSQWYSRRELARTRDMLATFTAWLGTTRSELTEVGVEVAVDGVLEPREEGAPAIRLRGRIDRLERDAEGRPVIVDVKTARAPVSKEDAQQHAQLAAYQVAAAVGAIEGEPASKPGGARLVFVAKPHKKEGATQRVQAPLSDEDVDTWLAVISAAAAATRGPQFLARVNDGCRHCPVRTSCPAHDEGRQVTSE
ncbi:MULTISPECIES: ATP-dependent DNA helicase [Rhodococcus]|uniref:DNA 3'-5' helicase n=1 Tax=Rhodococcus oxybenzonivorans TaxID=1990687 RepID=A0AAE4UW39_9NOCA|nr:MULTISPECIES: ATP-dependent DNA helicase [Rhodococcus]MDV7244660.1 ATP-dependent DNA helicase [Rhodococcus oxybenzonivorans]MDV7264030.1 ATP-dependent DNA helicase [Rhodococcus oxybenzonivorans]MDV7275840.1 ATP-dependent DNA helicase [Rhodococcus oxybenzonivorans]MDV7332618.1 ATP-dependent DNA helicase [Rhodococcus oxybenzonivorans]MDV7346414.1 ATP-dependent DNA helicase [Rhodococcus oxybenzonivorans]